MYKKYSNVKIILSVEKDLVVKLCAAYKKGFKTFWQLIRLFLYII